MNVDFRMLHIPEMSHYIHLNPMFGTWTMASIFFDLLQVVVPQARYPLRQAGWPMYDSYSTPYMNRKVTSFLK